MSKISMVAHLVAKPEALDEVQSLLEELVDSTTSEDDTELYVLNQDAADGASFWVYELYADDAALGVHGGSETMAKVMVGLDGKLAATPELIVVRPVKAKGIQV
jgi:quinol monooxygenase YgiN